MAHQIFTRRHFCKFAQSVLT